MCWQLLCRKFDVPGATIANNGRMMQPTIVHDVTDGDGNVVEMWFNPQDFQLRPKRQRQLSDISLHSKFEMGYYPDTHDPGIFL